MIRRSIIAFFLVLGFLYLSFGIITLHFQKVDNEKTLKEKGINQSIGNVVLRGYRGKILDTNNNLLAVEVPFSDVVIDPTLVQKELYPQLAKALKLNVKFLKLKIKHRQSRKYLALYKKLSQTSEIVKNIRILLKKKFLIKKNNEKIHGLFLIYSAKRYYPEGEVLAPLLGLTDNKLNGIDGLEKSYNKKLVSQNGIKKVVFNALRNEPIADVMVVKNAKQGQDIVLTIDKDMQYFAYKALKNGVLKHKAISGSAIILDNKGDILALVNYPSTNSNIRKRYNAKNYRNHVFLDSFDMGSTLKPFVAMLAMQKGKVDLKSKIITGPKRYQQKLSLRRVLEISHNKSMVKIVEKITNKELWQMFNDLGFGEFSGVLKPIENRGKLKHFYSWKESDKNSLSYGYGLDANLAQLAKAYLVLANEGHIVNLNLIKNQTQPRGIQIFSKKIVEQMNVLLQSVVLKGTAKKAQLETISVAGKTGTTRKYLNNAYDETKHRAIFVGFLPVKKPKYIMAIVIDEPKNKEYAGGNVAAPIFKETMSRALRINPI
jgi:cell division protein FtsI (penicillin-binding protein 3)